MNDDLNNFDTINVGNEAVTSRWGRGADGGFTAVPNTLIKAQSELGLSPAEFVVLCNLAMHWWFPNDMPFPRSDTIAKRMGVSQRSIQRTLLSLQRRGLIERRVEGTRNVIDLAGLKDKLAEVAPKHAWKARATGQLRGKGQGGGIPTPPPNG